MNVFEEIHQRLSSKTRIRSLFKDVHVDELERIINRLNSLLTEKIEARNKVDEERKEKLQSIEAVKQIMAEHGVSVEDLDSGVTVAKKKRRNIQRHLFQYETESGSTASWNGSTTGRLPKEFQSYLDRTGKKRAECIVKS